MGQDVNPSGWMSFAQLIIELLVLLFGEGLLWKLLKRWGIWEEWRAGWVWQMVLGVPLVAFVLWGGAQMLKAKSIPMQASTLGPVLTETGSPSPTPVSIGEQWFVYPQLSPQPRGRVTQRGFVVVAPNQISVEVYPVPRTERESAIYRPLEETKTMIEFLTRVTQIQGEVILYVGIIRATPITEVPAGWFFKVQKKDREIFEGIGQYEGFEDKTKVEQTYFHGKLEIEGNVLFVEASGLPRRYKLILPSGSYALYLGYKCSSRSSLAASVNFVGSEVNYVP